MSKTIETKALLTLCEQWEKQARIRFKAAEKEDDEFGKRFIENGAMIHFNHAQELRKLLDKPLTPNP